MLQFWNMDHEISDKPVSDKMNQDNAYYCIVLVLVELVFNDSHER